MRTRVWERKKENKRKKKMGIKHGFDRKIIIWKDVRFYLATD